MKLRRITVNADQMGGIPCIRALRIPVATVVGMIADGMTEAEILAAYPDLELEDISEALRFAAEAVSERELPSSISDLMATFRSVGVPAYLSSMLWTMFISPSTHHFAHDLPSLRSTTREYGL